MGWGQWDGAGGSRRPQPGLLSVGRTASEAPKGHGSLGTDGPPDPRLVPGGSYALGRGVPPLPGISSSTSQAFERPTANPCPRIHRFPRRHPLPHPFTRALLLDPSLRAIRCTGRVTGTRWWAGCGDPPGHTRRGGWALSAEASPGHGPTLSTARAPFQTQLRPTCETWGHGWGGRKEGPGEESRSRAGELGGAGGTARSLLTAPCPGPPPADLLGHHRGIRG